MSLAAYLRNGVRPAAEPTYFDLQPRMMRGTEETMQAKVPLVPRTYDPYRHALIPSATHGHHTRQVLGLKPKVQRQAYNCNKLLSPRPHFPF